MGQNKYFKSRSYYRFEENQTYKFSNKGFAIPILLIILPIVLASIIFIYLLTSHIEIQSHFYDICRTDLAQTQDLVSKELVLLMALNPIITTTEWMSVALKMALVFSYANPILNALFQSLIKGTESLERSIDKIQKTLINIMTRTMTFGLVYTKMHTSTIFANYKRKLSNLTYLNEFELDYIKKPHPAVEPTNKNKSPSTYKLKDDFEREQQLFISWSYSSKIQPKFSPYAILNKSFKGKCIYSLERSEPWNSIQIAVR